jgi:cytoskeletal protein CcmA (bactofilin family)
LFFRKKRYDDVEGYERISRTIEDRESDGEGNEGALEDDDTVLFTRGRGQADPSAASSAEYDDLDDAQRAAVEESVTVVRTPAPAQSREPVPTVTPAPMPAPAPAATTYTGFESPRMTLPDMSMATGQGGGASLVAKDAVWEGKLVCAGNIRIEGRLRGEIETQGTLFVAPEAQVDGTVRARNVTLAGEIKGDLRCEERLEILPGGAAHGDVDTGALIVHEGAFIDSRFQMRREAAVR